MRYYKLGRGGEETKYPEPKLLASGQENHCFLMIGKIEI